VEVWWCAWMVMYSDLLLVSVNIAVSWVSPSAWLPPLLGIVKGKDFLILGSWTTVDGIIA
jgi:hypothetical protein